MRHMPSQNIGGHQMYQGSFTPSARNMYYPNQGPPEGSFYNPVRSEKIVERRKDRSKGGKKGKKNFSEMNSHHQASPYGGGFPTQNPYAQPNMMYMGSQRGVGSIKRSHQPWNQIIESEGESEEEDYLERAEL